MLTKQNQLALFHFFVCILFFFNAFFLRLLFFLWRERKRSGERGRGRGRENPKEAPNSVGSLTWSLIPRPWDPDLSRNPESDAQPTEPPRHPSLYTFIMCALSTKFGFLLTRERNRNYSLLLPYSLLLCHHFQHKWLASIQGSDISKKGYEGTWGHLCFSLLSFCMCSNFWVEWEAYLLGLLAGLPADLVNIPDSLTLYSSWVLMNSYALWARWNSVLMGHHDCSMQVGLQRMAVPVSSAHICASFPSNFTYKTQLQR